MSRKAKIVLVIVISVVVLLIAGILGVALISSNTESSVLVNNMELKKGTVQNYVNATGVVASKDETYVRSLATYEIMDVKVSVGDKVKEGDVLCIIDDSTIKTQIAIAESNLQSASMSTYNALQTAERRYNDLLAASSGQDKATSTQVSITNAKNNLDNAQKAYDKAKEHYEDLRSNANYASAKANVDNAFGALRIAASDYNDTLEDVGLVPVYDVEGNYIGETHGNEY
ncbi:MAG: efflux RND transporter periplasmic adaptor subunit, partial [Oscillospiraceae bacterium]|nr:efflux RND transporter periplasmic adaptor subunit [Oscillospiraceae bacterium]